MSRIWIDVTDAQRAKLEAMAATRGLTVEEFVLSISLGEGARRDDLAELEALLDERMASARTEGVSRQSVGDIFRQAREDAGRRSGG